MTRKVGVKGHKRRTKGKVTKVKPHRRKIASKIRKDERKVFKHLSSKRNYQKEYGGAIDFNKKGEIEEIGVTPGEEFEVYVPDFEVTYHTHQNCKTSRPTPEDMLAFMRSIDQKAEIIFREGEAFIVIKTAKARKLEKKRDKALKDVFEEIWEKTGNSENKYKKELEKLGFKVRIDRNPKKDLFIDVKPVE